MASKKITGILIKLGLDTTDVEGGLQAIDKSIAKSTTELKQINKALKLDPTNTELLAQKYDVLSQALEKSRQKLKALEDAQEGMKKAAGNNAEYEKLYNPLQKSLSEATATLEKFKAKKEAMDKAMSEYTPIDHGLYDSYIKEIDKAEAAQKDFRKQLNDLEKEFSEKGGHITGERYREYQRELEQVRLETSKLEKQTKELEGVTDQSSKAFRKAVESTKEYQQAMDKLSASAGEFKSKVGGALNAIWDITLKVATALASAAAAGSAAAVKIGSEFDSSMSTVQALSGAVGTEFDTLREKAKEMGATTSKTAKESADALGYMALAGWDTQQMLEGLEPILRASEAGNMDLATASDLVTDSMSAMGVSVNDLTHYLDVATKAQSSSNTSLEEMLNAYVEAGGMLKNLNVGLDESATLLGILANRGIKGQEAGHALNSILINLVGANKNAASAMDALGVSAYDTEGKFIGITETLRLVDESLKKVSEQDKAIFTAKIGGKTQYDTLMALLNGVNGEYDDLLEKIQNSNGALEETSKIMRDNLQGDITTLKSTLADLGIEVNDQFTDAFREAVQVVTKEVAKLSNEVSNRELGESLKKIAEAFAKLLEQIAKFVVDKGIPATVNFFEFIADNAPLIKGLIVSIGSAFVAWKIISQIVIPTTKAINDFRDAMKKGVTATEALTKVLNVNPWVLLAAAVASVALGIAEFAYESRKAAKNIQETAEENIQAYKEQAEKVDSIETELKGVNSKIDEIKSKGKLSLVDEKAIEQLQIQNDKLTATLEIEKELLEIKRQQNETTLFEMADDGTIAHFEILIEQYNIAAEYAKNAQESINATIAAGGKASKSQKDTLSTWEKNALEAKQAIYDELYTINDLSASLDTTTERGKETAKIIKDVNSLVYNAFPKTVKSTNFTEDIFGIGGYGGYGEAVKETLDDEKQEVEDVVNDFLEDMKDLDKKKNTHQFNENDANLNDAAYWNERRRVLQKYLLKESEEWWKYYDETEEYFNSLTEEEKEAYEKQIDQQAEALKERRELNEEYTDEMYYDELAGLISTLDKKSDTYKKYNSEILKGRKGLAENLEKEAATAAKEQAETQIESVKNSISEIKAEYSQMLSDIVSEREAYKNKLLGMAELYSSEKDSQGNQTAILKNIDDISKAIDEYDEKIRNLEARGAGKNLINYMEGLSEEDAKNFEHFLNTMTDEQLKAYSDKYDKIIKGIDKKAEARYAPQVEAINKGFTDKVKAEFKYLSKDMEDAGKNAIDGFIKGFSENPEKLIDAVEKECNAVLDGFKNGLDIHSPSKKTEELGEYAGEGFEKGLESISGAGAAETFVDDFIKKMAEKDSQLHDVLYNAFAGNTADAIAAMNSKAQKALSSIPSLRLPSIPTVKIPTGASIQPKQQADNRILSALDDILNTQAMIISAIQQLANRPIVINMTLTNEEKLYLDGKQIADVVTKKQYQERKRNSS